MNQPFLHLLTNDFAASPGIQDPNSLLQSLGTSTPRCSVDIWLVNREIYEGKPRFPSWWLSFNPFEKYANHQIGSLFLQGSGWTFQKCLKPPPSCHVCILWYLGHMFRASSGPELSEFCLLFFFGVVSLYMTPGPKQCTSQEKEKSLKFIIHLYCLIPPKWVIYWT